MLKNFNDILHKAPKQKIIVAPPPGDKLKGILEDMEKEGFEVLYENKNNKEDSIKSAINKMKNNEGDILVQGDVHLSQFWKVLEEEGIAGEQTNYVSVLDCPGPDKLFFIADTYVSKQPNLKQKISLLDKLTKFAGNLGLYDPKVAALSAIESVNPAIYSTIEGAALAKVGDRGQIKAEIEGPLDIDTALSSNAAKIKGVNSSVPGNVDILLVPDVESGYALSQFMNLLGKMPVIGVLLGTPFPVVIDPAFIPFTHKKVEICAAALRGEDLD